MQQRSFGSSRRAVRGLTLVELVTTLAIAAILTTMAVASFQEITAQNHATAETQRILSSIFLARTEALRRNQQVTICRSANPSSETCGGGTAGDWSTGWLVFVDSNRSASRDSGEEILLVAEAIKGAGNNYVLKTSAAATAKALTYQPNGRYRTPSGAVTASSFVFCKKEYRTTDAQQRSRAVVINNAGRPKIARYDDMESPAQSIVGSDCDI